MVYHYIKNAERLLSHGDIWQRSKVLELLEAMWNEVDATTIIPTMMHVEGDVLYIGTRRWDLTKYGQIYMFGAGKACNAMAMAVGRILGDRLKKGVISVKLEEETDVYPQQVEVYVGGHPLPNEQGLKAARKILDMIDEANPEDLFISVISGGSSALLTCPVEGITLEDEIAAQDILLRSGAKIGEINAVRRHISQTNGGRLAQKIREKGAELINLIVDDGVGELPQKDRNVPVAYSATPIAADDTTLADARACIMNYGLKDKLPQNIVQYLWSAGPQCETPKRTDEKVTHFVLNSVPESCTAAVQASRRMGISSVVLTTFLEGEAREAGTFLGTLAREIQANGRPVEAPCFVFCSGETTTKVEHSVGTGGPGHEFAMGFAMEARNVPGAVLASVDTEGTDGTTKYAGGLADSQTVSELLEAGYDYYEVLREHMAGDALADTGNSIYTGNTGTNLCDFNVMYVPCRAEVENGK